MGKKHRNLFEQIIDADNLREAYRRARRDKRMTPGHLQFKEHAEANLSRIAWALEAETYVVPPYHTFTVFEPKAREIMALPFYDRVVQHALCNVIEPIFDAMLLPMAAACRKGKGTHYGANRAQMHMRRLAERGPVFCLKMDFSKYFASIDRAVLHREIRRKITCARTLRLIEAIVPTEGRGLPIGNLTSQLFANLYGHILDRFLVHEAGVTTATRYMDDTVIFASSLDELHFLKGHIDRVVSDVMGLRFSKWSIQPISRGVNFLGFRMWPTHRLLRRDSVKRAKRTLRILRARGDQAAIDRFLPAWRGHAGHANARNLFRSLGLVESAKPHLN
ncbi:MAG TPA: reverse transcriptase domain-containing protein [Chthoniobacterales bacterium]